MFCRGQDGNLVQLGAGAYGQVYKAFLHGLHPVAVKVFQTQVGGWVGRWMGEHLPACFGVSLGVLPRCYAVVDT